MKIARRSLAGIVLALLSTFAFAGNDSVRVQDPWIREAPPVAKVLAAYMKIENVGDDAQVLKGVSSPEFEHVMLHGSRIEDGVAEMFHLDQVEIQPGETAVFEPGGNHFMLMGLKRPLRDGDNAVLNLDFGDGGTVSISVSVRRVAAGHTAHH